MTFMGCVMIMDDCICWVICIIWPWSHQPIQKNRCIYFSAFESSSTPFLFNFEINCDENFHFQFDNFQHNWKFQLGTGSSQKWLISSSSFQSQQSVNFLFMHFLITNLQIQVLNFVVNLNISTQTKCLLYEIHNQIDHSMMMEQFKQMSMLSQSYQTYTLAPP